MNKLATLLSGVVAATTIGFSAIFSASVPANAADSWKFPVLASDMRPSATKPFEGKEIEYNSLDSSEVTKKWNLCFLAPHTTNDILRAYIDRTGITLKSYLKMYKNNDILLRNMKDTNLDQYKNTIATVWDLSFEKICDQNKFAELILSYCVILQIID